MPQTTVAVLVELDTLLDTRLATIARLAPEAAVKVLQEGYHRRDRDVFAGSVDQQAFEQLYRERDEDTLAESKLTNIVLVLSRLMAGLGEQAIMRPYFDAVELIVNVHPYKLSERVCVEIGTAVSARMHGTCTVRTTSIRPEDLTPEFCKNSYAMMVMYDPYSWMNIHAEAFWRTRIPGITLVAPALIFNKDTKSEDLGQLATTIAHPMQAMQMLASQLIGLELIDPLYFSVLSLDRLDFDVIKPPTSSPEPKGQGEEEGLPVERSVTDPPQPAARAS